MDTWYCLKQDESGHWYCIPVDMANIFESYIKQYDWDAFEETFNEHRLGMHVGNYEFRDFRERKK